MDLQNIENDFSSRPVQFEKKSQNSNQIPQKQYPANSNIANVLQQSKPRNDQSMIGTEAMPWNSIPQKQISFQNIEQVGQKGQRQSQVPALAIASNQQHAGVVTNKDSYVHKSMTYAVNPSLLSSNQQQINHYEAKDNSRKIISNEIRTAASTQPRQESNPTYVSRPDVDYNSYLPQQIDDSTKAIVQLRI